MAATLFRFAIIGLLCSVVRSECVGSSPRAPHVLECSQPGAKIVHVNMTAGTGTCKHTGCHGEPASLLVQTHNCYWSNNCTVGFPIDPIIKARNDTCFGHVPTFLHLHEYRCFSPKESKSDHLLDMHCGDKRWLTSEQNEKEKENGNSYGLIRSHSYYPWLYDMGGQTTCSKDIFGPMGKRLVLTVLNLDLGESDTLEMLEMLADGKTTDPVTVGKGMTLYANHAGKVTFRFKVDSDSNGGRGFLICYKFIEMGERLDNVCDNITSRHIDFMKKTEQNTMTASDVPAPTNTVRPVDKQETTLKPECYNKKGKLKKKCRPKKPKKQRKCRGKAKQENKCGKDKKGKGKRDKKDRKDRQRKKKSRD